MCVHSRVLGPFAARVRLLPVLDSLSDPSGAHASQTEPGTQLSGVVLTDHTVPGLFVRRQRCLGPAFRAVVLDPLQPSRLSTLVRMSAVLVELGRTSSVGLEKMRQQGVNRVGRGEDDALNLVELERRREARRRRQTWSDHLVSEVLNGFSKVRKDVGRLRGRKRGVLWVDERLEAVVDASEVDRVRPQGRGQSTLKRYLLRRDFRVDPDAGDVDALLLEVLDDLGHDDFGSTERDEQVRRELLDETVLDVVDGLS